VDYVLFSDSAVKAATNLHQWYVTISSGKKGIHVFTTDKAGLRENTTRSGVARWRWMPWRETKMPARSPSGTSKKRYAAAPSAK
jgi:hypothetical protein